MQGLHGQAGKVQLFIGVLSSAARRRHRNAIRATWGADKRLFRCSLWAACHAICVGPVGQSACMHLSRVRQMRHVHARPVQAGQAGKEC